jgi:hypothetical protein
MPAKRGAGAAPSMDIEFTARVRVKDDVDEAAEGFLARLSRWGPSWLAKILTTGLTPAKRAPGYVAIHPALGLLGPFRGMPRLDRFFVPYALWLLLVVQIPVVTLPAARLAVFEGPLQLG